MRIKSNATCNIAHTVKGHRVLFPAQGILELDDEKFEGFVPFINAHVKSGNFGWLKKPAESAEKQAAREAAELEAARKLIAKAEAAKKAAKE